MNVSFTVVIKKAIIAEHFIKFSHFMNQSYLAQRKPTTALTMVDFN
jgi:hypothetical protein